MIQVYNQIYDRIGNKKHLKLITSSAYDIPRRLREIDSNLFVVFNVISQRYEIHSLANKGNSFSLNVPFKELDARLENFIRKYDLKRHGNQIYRDMEKHNDRLERSKQRQRDNDLHGIAEEIHPYVKKLAWEGV